ncbi:MAG: FAD-dependent oxidoreductase [Clostridia bacterium]|nr:FAD-dependent oxidoreductase [Clostridia bacterium]
MADVNKKIKRSDVVICGGGLAGSAAAIAAARLNKKVVLVESSGVLGGIATLGLVTPLDSRESKSRISFGGILEEICDKTIFYSRKYCKDNLDKEGKTIDIAAPHILKYVLLKTCVEAGVEIMFHSELVSAKTNENVIKSVMVQTKSGQVEIFASEFIDGSGDGILIYESGAPYILGSEANIVSQLSDAGYDGKDDLDTSYKGKMQPVSIFFSMGGVEPDIAKKYNGRSLEFGELGITREIFEKWEFAGTCGFEITDNTIPTPQNRILMTETPRVGVMAINMSRVLDIDGSDADSLNKGEIEAQLQVIALVDFLKSFVPGFENAYLIESGSTLGIRESRRLIGKYVLKGLDVYYTRKFENAIGRGFYLIDIHDPRGKTGAIGGDIKGDYYEIPYGTLINGKVKNLLVCGRCISADHMAHSATRIQGTCVITGQAAGTAAALAIEKGTTAFDLDESSVHAKLQENGVFLV